MTGMGAVCCVYDDCTWLALAIESCYAAVDRMFFLMNDHPWNGTGDDNIATLHVIRSCPDPENKLNIIHGDWVDEASQRNAGLEFCRRAGLSYCFVLDADEIYDPATLAVLSKIAMASNVGVWHIFNVTYWKSYLYKIDPPEPMTVPLIVHVETAGFVKSRIANASSMRRFPRQLGVCHHMSYARSDGEILKKITRSTRAGEMRRDWFANVWLEWDGNHELTNLHPIWPAAYRRATLQNPAEYPPVLRRIYDREQQAP
jgi:hypothetical protein